MPRAMLMLGDLNKPIAALGTVGPLPPASTPSKSFFRDGKVRVEIGPPQMGFQRLSLPRTSRPSHEYPGCHAQENKCEST